MLLPWTPSGGLGQRGTLVVGGLGSDGRGFESDVVGCTAVVRRPFGTEIMGPFGSEVKKPFAAAAENSFTAEAVRPFGAEVDDGSR